MLTQQFPFLDPIHATPDLTMRLRALADDAARLQQVRSVSPARLRTAPLLKYWTPLRRPEGLRLIGQVSGHPLIKGPMIMTSPLWFADPKGRWVRTLSRYYRLGPPANQTEAGLMTSLKITMPDTPDDETSEDRA
ncbi:DUF6634 family protein [Bradyrhizobium sp. G127]|uniref:DUF6634 family protein n=1 Tax=Bradyrhizobium sp. G127 TaxID=2904800 RepID=UPI001BB84CCA|nr:DUF6634 family protein [Bradyrhizobium sp. G127]MBS4004940.1 hypothetical protein [Afipia sp.]MCF2521662.1 hypothetical protein [Bradyrhizobium sp. G127]